MMFSWRSLILTLIVLNFQYVASERADEDCTDLARDEEPLLVFSTLGGGLIAIDPVTNEQRWNIDDDPAINVPSSNEFPLPHYLPDPRDGSLYQLGDMGGLKKLPYTIPQLVASAPCRSSDGILYSGKKSDTWFLIDPKTGHREKVMDFANGSKGKDGIGWATSRSIYLGRTQYTIMMYDSHSQDSNAKPWNVTFFDYASHSMGADISKDYEFLHLTGSENGLAVTLDRRKGTYMWQREFSSPVVAVYLLGPEGLLSVPFTTVSDEALRNIIEYTKDGTKTDMKLFQSLYIGEHSLGLYAIPSLVDKNTATIASDPPTKLLEGPKDDKDQANLVYINTLLEKHRSERAETDTTNNNGGVVVLGHYQVPKVMDNIGFSFDPALRKSDEENKNGLTSPIKQYTEIHINSMENGEKILPDNSSRRRIPFVSNITERFENNTKFLKQIYTDSKKWVDNQESQIMRVLLIILFGVVIAMFWYMRFTVRELRQSQTGSHQNSGRSQNGSYQELIDMGDQGIRVGKITFFPNELLGKGCEGTFVFKGCFEKRQVAVKRLLPECFTLADREVALLRESDTHENVVRYFCTEQDRQFRYIAVELCDGTLQDYTEGPRSATLRDKISVFNVLLQATNGLHHLHSLNIVHRDIKPQNVLLSLPNNYNQIRVMISDFGLCKKLNLGKNSFSRRSGITGTEGWIAPEMLKGQRTTTSVDIFSLGCVFYYVMTGGSHPFGDTMKRQANILGNEFYLKELFNAMTGHTTVLAEELISDMINKDQNRRPPAMAICNHPLFWNEERILAFFQDVSDRVEKSIPGTEPLKTLEKNAKFVVRNDWNVQLDALITVDLRKYRDYQGGSVRDLLRAFRNKKHHYHELDFEVQKLLGTLPAGFTNYWIDKFPHLLSHSYHVFERCKPEPSFKSYYSKNYSFTKPDYFDSDTSDNDYIPPDIKEIKKDKLKEKNMKSMLTKSKKGSYNFHRIDFTDDPSFETEDHVTSYVNNSPKNFRSKDYGPKYNRRAAYNFHRQDNGDFNNDSNDNFRRNLIQRKKPDSDDGIRWTLPTK